MNMNPGDDKLQAALADWRVAPTRAADFRAAVWARIERRRGDATWGNYMRAHAVPCAALLAVALVIGAWTGRGRARAQVDLDRAALATSYVQALDARTMRMP
jgi:hypothetical protein